MKEALSFFWEFCRDPAGVASILPTTPWAAQKITGTVPDEKWKQDLIITEYGPGTGAVTRKIRERMSENSKLILIEKDRKFYKQLCSDCKDDDRVSVFCDGAEHADRIVKPYGGKVDLNFDMTPLTIMPPELRRRILMIKKELLKSDGSAVVSLFRWRIGRHLREVFPSVTLKGIAWLNIPPLLIYEVRPVADSVAVPTALPDGMLDAEPGVIPGRT